MASTQMNTTKSETFVEEISHTCKSEPLAPLNPDYYNEPDTIDNTYGCPRTPEYNNDVDSSSRIKFDQLEEALLSNDQIDKVEAVSTSESIYNIQKAEAVSPSQVENLDEPELSPTNVEYLDDEFLDLSDEYLEEKKSEGWISPGKSDVKDSEKVPVGSEIDYHHENLRTVLRCSNATPFTSRGVWYSCSFCSAKYEDARNLKAHTIRNHNETESQLKLYVIRQIRRYVVKLDITDLKCNLCSKEIHGLQELLEHLDRQHSETVHMDLPNHLIPFKFDNDEFRCVECDKKYSSFKMLLCHMNEHYKNYFCNLCNSAYVTYGSLIQHLRTHADGEYTCKQCQKTYDSKYKLSHHIKIVHLGKRKRNKCAYCAMGFQVFEDRNTHMEKVHGLKAPVVQCQACDRTFRSTRYLNLHMKKFHLIEKRYKCSLCESRFFDGYMLKSHMAVHSSNKDYKCVVCDKAYARKKTLREHMRIHANDRRFRCEYCGMAFVQKCSMTAHVRSKHGDNEIVIF